VEVEVEVEGEARAASEGQDGDALHNRAGGEKRRVEEGQESRGSSDRRIGSDIKWFISG
jgi:hypothetical protein